MDKKKLLRVISLIMLTVAVIFVFCALANPILGSTIYIGNYAFGVKQWLVCYAFYMIVMIVLFISSFFVREKIRR